MKTHHTNAYRATRLMAVGARECRVEYTTAAHTGRESEHLPQFYRRVRSHRTYIKRSAVARSLADLVRTWLRMSTVCATVAVTRFPKKSRSGKGWLMSGREASKNQTHLQLNFTGDTSGSLGNVDWFASVFYACCCNSDHSYRAMWTSKNV